MCWDTLQQAARDIQGSTITEGVVKDLSTALKQPTFSPSSLHLWKVAAWSYASAYSVNHVPLLEQQLSKVAPMERDIYQNRGTNS